MELVEGGEGSSSTPPRDKVYVAVGSKVKQNQKNLEWALAKFGAADFFILHIHIPSPTMPAPMGGKMPCSGASEQKVKEFRKEERMKMEEVIQQYMAICAAHKVNVDKLELESSDVQRGIVELVAQCNIKILVMGAGADQRFDKTMSKPASSKAQYVEAKALPSCQIWFVCKGNHICTRQVATSHNPTRIAPWRIHSEKLSQSSTKGKSMIKQFFSFPAVRDQSSSQEVTVPQLGRDASGASSIFSSDDGSGASEWSAPTEENDDDDVDDGGVSGELKRESEEMTLLEGMAQLSVKIEELQRRNGELERENTSLSAKNSALHQQLAELTHINRSLQKQNDEAKQAQKQLEEAQLALTNIDKGMPAIPNFLQFNLAELKEATKGFSQEMKIGRGGYGTVYKGKLHHTTVAIKILNPETIHGEAQFNQEIQALTRVRHPNLVALIGACPEERCIVYEYVENGNLNDHIFCDDSPLSWKDRLRIAAEICLALLFLHSAKPHPIVHGDLKPANILLDANNKTKIADFGICRFLSEPQRESIDTVLKLTHPKGTLGYMDPEFMATKELTFKSDVYAFGIILLQLLTGKSELGLVKEVETALENKVLPSILDPNAGKWKLTEATKLSNLGLQCCQTTRRSRPNLETQVWRQMERYL
ncbi:U-box domain-containing protein 33-like [Nymphaea colorata]|nr:U-box domain-containing protein 33-like [Nymphaea colorata]XP_031484505.1 U-box domain-containing protein 33-like [Nymphaea colorata]XP_031484506.1 U-box domain-containing protein 33-like [Nymphaea colorata]